MPGARAQERAQTQTLASVFTWEGRERSIPGWQFATPGKLPKRLRRQDHPFALEIGKPVGFCGTFKDKGVGDGLYPRIHHDGSHAEGSA